MASEQVSFEHQLRYEIARAEIYREAFRRMAREMRCAASEIESVVKSKMDVLNHDWRKVAEAGFVQLKDPSEVFGVQKSTENKENA